MTDEERCEVAAELRELAEDYEKVPAWDVIAAGELPAPVDDVFMACGLGRAVHATEICGRLADLIEPEERTCHIEPLSLHELFAGEKYTLSSDARESAEDERFDRLSRELEKDAHFTCSSCHALFGTHEVANADYDILEDGTYEVSGVAPIIKFCPYCGAKVIHDA